MRVLLSKRDFHGEDYYIKMIQEHDKIRQRRKAMKWKPDEYERVELEADRVFESFYKGQL